MLEYDVAIVGGGPVGGHIASKIAGKDYSIAVLEKNKEIGQYLNCAGLVTSRVFDLAEIPKKEIVQNEIKGANIHSPSNKILTIGGDKTHALSIDRTLFDKKIVEKSEKKGADVFLNSNVKQIKKTVNGYEVLASKNQIKCKLLIGADGPNSKVRKLFSFPDPKEYLVGVGAEVTNAKLDPNFVEIFAGSNFAPGFFAWIIPTNCDGTNARIGLCINQDAPKPAKHYFSIMFKHRYYAPFLKKCKIIRQIGGVIPLGALKKTYDENIMLVGDAAAQVKPTSGGGLFPGLLCAKNCSDIAINSLESNNFSAQFLKDYQNLWQKEIGSELKRGMRFRSIFKRLTDDKIDKYIQKLNNPKILEIINEHGDIDYPSKLVKPLLKNTKLFI